MNINENTTATVEANPIQVGKGMTKSYPQDSYPYVIVRVSDSGKTVWVKPIKSVNLETGHEPAYFNGPFPVWSHSYTEEEMQSMMIKEAPELAVRLTKRGWSHRGIPFRAGKARYHRDYSY